MDRTSPMSSSRRIHIPEQLLALAKDSRYISSCRELLSQILPRYDFDTIDSTTATAWAILLYSVLVVRRSGRTLGMEFMGLQPQSTTLWKRMAGIALFTLLWNYHHSKQHQQAQQQQRQQQQQQQSIRVSTWWSRTIEWISTNQIFIMVGPHQLQQHHHQPQHMVMKLILAYYCWTEQWPLQMSLSNIQNNAIVNPPKSHRIVALLIGIQAIGKWIPYLMTTILSTTTHNNTIYNNNNNNHHHHPINEDETITTTHSQCVICHMPRTVPAMPITCGHVCCWSCLHHWMSSTHRQECPFCRQPCRPQDIMTLYQYEPKSIHPLRL
jgi:hypothetical protein